LPQARKTVNFKEITHAGDCKNPVPRNCQRQKVNGTLARNFVVANLSLADWGRKEIAIAEHEMPGLMAISQENMRPPSRFQGARIAGSFTHDDSDGRSHRDLQALGAKSAGELQYLLHAKTTPPPPSRQRHTRSSQEGRDARRYWD